MARQIDYTDVSKEVRALLKRTGEKDPAEAVRVAAREILSPYLELFGDKGPPINLEALASSRSITIVGEQPVYSEDAELVPDEERGLIMRINSDRPRTRQRFSIGHEVGHTLFDGYDSKVQCRKTGNRDWHAPSDVLEYLCDVASSEFLLPIKWFKADLRKQDITAERLLALSLRYQASPEATIRRFIDLTKKPTAAIFFRWQNKPTEDVTTSSSGSKRSSGRTRRELPKKLRIDYSVCNDAFATRGGHIPRWKSVAETSVIYRAAFARVCMDANRELLELGGLNGWYQINVLPTYTKDEDLGPDGRQGVIAVLRPVPQPRPK